MTEQKHPPADDTESKAEAEDVSAAKPDKEPSAQSQEPSAQSQEPSAETQEPSAETQEPSAESQEPSTQSQEPSETEAASSAAEQQAADIDSALSDPEQPDADSKAVQPTTAKPKGRGLAVLALLLALAGAAGVGYLYYLLVYLQPLEQVRVDSAEMGARYGELEQSLQAQIASVEAATSASMAELQAQQAERLASTEAAVSKSLNEALQAAPPSQREWKLAEAEYLLRIANHRVLMEQDSVGALSLLQAADQIMADLDDFALHQVRARLADEIIALRQVPRDDLQGIYLRIESIKSQIGNLPLPQPSFNATSADAAAEQTVWQTLYDEMKKFIRVRSLDDGEALQPLLAPEEAQYLELNLRLALEQAQLATLKRQQAVYEQSLLNVRRWLVAHADASDARTKALLESVDELMVLELARPMPEISGSLNELLSVRRGGS